MRIPPQLRSMLENIVSGIIANITLSLLVMFAPPLIFIVRSIVGDLPAFWGSLFSVLWITSFSLFFLFYEGRRVRRITRWRLVAEMMFLSDYRVRAFHLDHLDLITSQGLQPVYNQAIRTDIVNALQTMLQLIAMNIPQHEKAAAFMVVRSSDQGNVFIVVEHANHERLFYRRDQPLPFGPYNSFAGLALHETQRCLVMHNHQRRLPEVPWWDNPRSDYHGHAAVSVEGERDDGSRYPVGVLCIDFKRPYTLNEEDEIIAVMCADKIGTLWAKHRTTDA